MLRIGAPFTTMRRCRQFGVKLVGRHPRQIGVIGREIDHVLIAQMQRERGHHRVDPRAGLEVVQLLVDHGGKIARQGWANWRRLTPCGPWQIAQRWASVAPRPIESWLGLVSISDVITTSEVLKSGWIGAACEASTRHAGGAADRVPDAGNLQVGLREGQQTRPTNAATASDRRGQADARDEPWIARREQRWSLSLIAALRHRPRARRCPSSAINCAIG